MKLKGLACLLVMCLSLGVGSTLAKARGDAPVRVEPLCWWTGMANDTLQVLVSGKAVGMSEFAVEYPGVELLEQVALDSPNYKILYLRIKPEAQAGNMRIEYRVGKKKRVIDYELKARDRTP